MTETIYLNIGLMLWGVVLGLFYFGGLWLTVHHLSNVKNQALWMLGSFMTRNFLVAIGFYPVVLQGWQPALFCLTGCIGIRFILTSRIKVDISK